MNILFTLCGRAGSKGVKGKNARDFLDVPLVWYSMANIALYMEKYAGEDDIKIVLNTDSEPLKDLVRCVKDVPVTIIHREESLAGDKVPKVKPLTLYVGGGIIDSIELDTITKEIEIDPDFIE